MVSETEHASNETPRNVVYRNTTIRSEADLERAFGPDAEARLAAELDARLKAIPARVTDEADADGIKTTVTLHVPARLAMSHAVARWEGDKLVVEFRLASGDDPASRRLSYWVEKP